MAPGTRMSSLSVCLSVFLSFFLSARENGRRRKLESRGVRKCARDSLDWFFLSWFPRSRRGVVILG